MNHAQQTPSAAENAMWEVMLGFLADVLEQINGELRQETNLSLTDWILLVRLYQIAQPITMSALAEEALFTPTRLSNRAKVLEDLGLVQRVPNPQSKRSSLISLTDAGVAFVERIRPIHLQQLHTRYSNTLSEKELVNLTTSVAKMLHA